MLILYKGFFILMTTNYKLMKKSLIFHANHLLADDSLEISSFVHTILETQIYLGV